MHALADVITKRRQVLGLSIEEVAQQSKIKATYLRQIESGNYLFAPDQGFSLFCVLVYAEFLGIANKTVQAMLNRDIPEIFVPSQLKLQHTPKDLKLNKILIAIGACLIALITVLAIGRLIYISNLPPEIRLFLPIAVNSTTNPEPFAIESSQESITIAGSALRTAELRINGTPFALSSNGEFIADNLLLTARAVRFTVAAIDLAGRSSEIIIDITKNPNSITAGNFPLEITGITDCSFTIALDEQTPQLIQLTQNEARKFIAAKSAIISTNTDGICEFKVASIYYPYQNGERLSWQSHQGSISLIRNK